jgi:indolepyruvate ferredoxin oxidoreductase beta subunit
MNQSGKSILIVGVGGQGTLLASRVLGSTMLEQGYDVKVSEVHGMSQRGGSVTTYVRYGDCVASPVIQEGEADLILAFEQLEAARSVGCLKPGGTMIVNTQQIDPMPVVTGAMAYPDHLVEEMREKGCCVVGLDALSLAQEAGSVKAVNVVMIGAMASYLDLDKEIWLESVKKTVPPKFVELNVKAFQLGYEAGKSIGTI